RLISARPSAHRLYPTFLLNHPAPTVFYPLSLHDALPICLLCLGDSAHAMSPVGGVGINLAIQDAVAAANILVQPLLRGAVRDERSEEHTSELQSRENLVCRLLLEKKKTNCLIHMIYINHN